MPSKTANGHVSPQNLDIRAEPPRAKRANRLRAATDGSADPAGASTQQDILAAPICPESPASERETPLMRKIRFALNSIEGVRVWRNDVGEGTIIRSGGRREYVRYGLAPGSADLVGIAWGRLLAVEVKTKTGRVSGDQERWLSTIRKLGGIALVARSVDAVVLAVKGYRPEVGP
jgi:hypothetical protein